MESNVAPVEKKDPDELPPSYSSLGHEQPPPPGSYYPPSQPTQYPNTQQPQPMMYPNAQHPQFMVPPTQVVTVENVNDYMGLSLVTLLCCCWPIGICAVMSSLRVRDALRVGDHVGAMNASRSARSLNIAGIVIGCIVIVIVIVAVVVAIVVRVNSCTNRRYSRDC
ncbi:synapse differentiation-inducing gene protein 1-like [Corticium candelabrum]|uniref:synapse differentiation-inducing gene protein 1-like n=1 Tax=Corticium candelabrum TaxID=121492 RepID=UPI002E26308B|nr:synapse differentiation-inducing gene protein 1-like [Corticium candelabrum]